MKHCEAKQFSDEMKCDSCGISWDMNDPEPPQCLKQKSIIWIVEGEIQKRGTTDDEFVGAALSKKEAFDVIANSRKEYYITYKICQYDLKKKSWVGYSETIYPHQKYNHAKDGHLDPPENRNKKGLCKSRGSWGPYCSECLKDPFEHLPPINIK